MLHRALAQEPQAGIVGPVGSRFDFRSGRHVAWTPTDGRAPGELVPVHTHRWPATIYVARQSDFLRRDQDGNLLFDSRTLGPPPAKPLAQWTPPLPPHSVENIGSSEILLISTELKEPA